MVLINGNLFDPNIRVGGDWKVICHGCNNKGKFGKGFALILANKYPKVRQRYWDWYKKGYYNVYFGGFQPHPDYRPRIPFQLGEIQPVWVDLDRRIRVVNMITQDGVYGYDNPRPFRYDALEQCLSQVRDEFSSYSIHMPKIGTGLARGDWDKIKPIIEKYTPNAYVYYL